MNHHTHPAQLNLAGTRPVTGSMGTGPEKSARDEAVRPQVYTVEQVADILQIGRDKVYMLLRTGRLCSMKIGRLRRITAWQLADFIASVEE